jgi:hypothetical protein
MAVTTWWIVGTEMTIPVKKDTAPPAIRKLAEKWLLDSQEFCTYLDGRACAYCQQPRALDCNCPIPDEWLDALACDLDGALADRLSEWVRTLKEGRPPTMYVVEWQAPL